jgi:1,4-dihydroxy-6-naphthoate synthase
LRALSLGYSPCPNDTFIFYALTHGIISTDHLTFNEVLLDVEALNQKALKEELDITKISYHALGHLRDNYCLLNSGGALGRGCGPLLIAKNNYSIHELRDKKIAIPGKLTTAYMLLQLYDPAFRFHPSRIFIMPFDRIMESVAGGETDAGLIIHESRFTYPSYGLSQVIDLGQWWESETGLPIPLGGIIANRSLGKDMILKIDNVVKNSVEYAFNHRTEPLPYVKQHCQELSNEVIEQHINLYVNDFSIGLKEEGQMAVTEFLMRAESAGIIPESKKQVFI